MHDTRALVHAVAGADQRLLVLVHEFGPAFGHDDDMEIGFMAVPAGALFRRIVGTHQLGDDLAGGGFGNAEVAVNEKVAQSVHAELRVVGFDMGELGDGSIEHGEAPCRVTSLNQA